jgi:hypothetical protein
MPPPRTLEELSRAGPELCGSPTAEVSSAAAKRKRDDEYDIAGCEAMAAEELGLAESWPESFVIQQEEFLVVVATEASTQQPADRGYPDGLELHEYEPPEVRARVNFRLASVWSLIARIGAYPQPRRDDEPEE